MAVVDSLSSYGHRFDRYCGEFLLKILFWTGCSRKFTLPALSGGNAGSVGFDLLEFNEVSFVQEFFLASGRAAPCLRV
jgi:hypothetical protein